MTFSFLTYFECKRNTFERIVIVVINICPNCKGILGSDAVFCTKCGANIKALKNNKDNVEPINSYPVGLTKDDIVQPSDNSEERTENSKKHSHSSKVLRKYPFSNIATVCWLIAIALVIFGIILPIPEKHIDTWRTGALGSEWSGDEYTEYVGGDAYNIMIEGWYYCRQNDCKNHFNCEWYCHIYYRFCFSED